MYPVDVINVFALARFYYETAFEDNFVKKSNYDNPLFLKHSIRLCVE